MLIAKQELEYATTTLDFSNAVDLVDPFETTIRYLGALVSTVDLLDANFSQQQFARPVPRASRDALVRQAVSLAHRLAPGFDTPTGMIWPRINFTEGVGCREEEGERPYPDYDHATIGPARAGSNWLENYGLSRLTGNPAFVDNATRAWRSVEPPAGRASCIHHSGPPSGRHPALLQFPHFFPPSAHVWRGKCWC